MVKQKANADGFGKFKFELTGVGSRVVVIPEHITLDKVHELVQGLFHWENYHQWEFHDGAGRNFGYKGEAEWMSPSDDRLISPSKVCLSDVLPERGGKLRYTYDFGDDWRHMITRMADPKTPGIYCVKTEGPDGIEDIGGVWGLQCCKKDWHVPDVAEITNRLVRIRFNPKKSGRSILTHGAYNLSNSRIAPFGKVQFLKKLSYPTVTVEPTADIIPTTPVVDVVCECAHGMENLFRVPVLLVFNPRTLHLALMNQVIYVQR